MTTPLLSADELKDARMALGLSFLGMADALELTGRNRADVVREMEAGRRPISGPVSAAVKLMIEAMGEYRG